MQKVEKLKSICLQYAAATQWLITSAIDIGNNKGSTLSDDDASSSPVLERFKHLKLRNKSQLHKLTPEGAKVIESTLYVSLSACVLVCCGNCVILTRHINMYYSPS